MTGDSVLTRRKGLRLGTLLRAALAFFLAASASRLALYLAPWQPPVKYAGPVVLLLALGLVVYGVKWAWQWLRTVSLARALVFALLCYFLVVAITGLKAWGQAGFSSHWLDVAISVPLDAGRAVSRGARALVQFPGRFLTEFSGPSLAKTGDTETASMAPPALANASIPPIQIGTTSAKAGARVFSIGDAATTADQAARLCQMDVFSDGPFTTGTQVRLIEGPRYVTDEQWWRVRSDVNSGWCPSSALLP